MSYRTARDKIIALIEATTPTSKKLGLGSRFSFQETGTDDRKLSNRSVFVRLLSGRIHTPLTSQTRRRQANFEVTVVYRLGKAVSELEAMIAEDAEAISDKLLNVSLWDRATSKLTVVSTPAPDFLPWRVESEEGRMFLVFELQIEYTD